jgi:DNA-binding NtrC family response regulator
LRKGSDGREAVEIFSANPQRFTLVLMDLTMPHLDGKAAFASLRRVRGDVRVVLMSGFNEQEAVSQFTEKGLAGFLQKPFLFEALTATVRRAFEV